MSKKVWKQAKKLGVEYSVLFMQANGKQLSEITKLIEADSIRPAADKVFSFAQINEALDYVASVRAKRNVVVKIR